MWKDPIVAETRTLRDEYARQFNYDIEAILEDLMKKQAIHPERVVSLPPRKAKGLHSMLARNFKTNLRYTRLRYAPLVSFIVRLNNKIER